MPWWPDAASNRRIRFWRVFSSSAVIISSASESASGRFCEWVGMMWSTVANVRSGKRTGSPLSRSISNACGLVTSWIRCSPMNSWVWPVGSSRTVCASQTLSSRLLPGGAMAEG
jgi:hypothetical protein